MAVNGYGRSVRRVVVVGAGAVGLSCALHLCERFAAEQLEVTLISDKFSPRTTSDKAGTLLMPFDSRSEEDKELSAFSQDEELKRWTKGTFQKFHSIFKSKENSNVEICLEQGYIFQNRHIPDPWWKDEVFGFRHVALDSVEADVICIPPDCVDVWAFSTYLVNTSSYIQWLLEKIKEKGVAVEERKISNLDELSSYDITVNCTGIGSRELLGDKLMFPVRGQAALVEAPWLTHWILHYHQNGINYVFPRSRDVVLGGTIEAGDWSENPEPSTTKSIFENCQKIIPSLCKTEVVREWVGLRPYRDPIRLESCPTSAGNLLIHCYGHGGQGIVLSWGSAQHIGDIVEQRLNN